MITSVDLAWLRFKRYLDRENWSAVRLSGRRFGLSQKKFVFGKSSAQRADDTAGPEAGAGRPPRGSSNP